MISEQEQKGETMHISLEELQKQMFDNGYIIGTLQADGNFHNFPVDGHKGEPGYYVINQRALGLMATYGDFASGSKYSWSASNNGKQSLTPEEAEDLKQRMAAEAAKLEASQKRKHEKGAMSASFFWDMGKEAKSHPYLQKKKVKNHGLRILDLQETDYHGWLIVPGYNCDGVLQTVQYISGQGGKRYEKDGQKTGAFYEISGDNSRIVLTEGYATGASIHEATGHTVVVAFDAGNLIHVARAIREKYQEAEIILGADNDQWKPEAGNTGVRFSEQAAVEISGKVAIPQFKNTETKPKDFNDLACLEGPEVVKEQIDTAEPVDKVRALKLELAALAELDKLEQEMGREQLSKKYDVRKSVIDEYLSAQAGKEKIKNSIVEEVEPAKHPVDGVKLLNGILDDLQRRVILPVGAAVAITLWILLTYLNKAFSVLAILGIVSPTKRCGKTKLLEILQAYASKALPASNISPAAVYRTIEKFSPTLLIDEADTFLKNNDELRGVINSGHTRSNAFVVRVEGDNHEPVKFSTWGSKAISMIGALPETIADRAIIIELSRKMPGEKIQRTRIGFSESCKPIRAKCQRWADDNFEQIRSAIVTVPESGNDRADDNWQSLFAIAEVIGGDWPEKVKKSMTALVGESEDSIGTKLLTDIRDIFEKQVAERVFSRDLVEFLNLLTESPWSDWSRGKGLSTNGLSRLLKPFGVTPKTLRIDGDLAKGYGLESFKDVFKRYIPGNSSVTTEQPYDINRLWDKTSVTQKMDVTDENKDNHLNSLDCYAVTDENGINGTEEEKSRCYECKACDTANMLCCAFAVFEGKSGKKVPCQEAVLTCQH